jgi:hypothetical protein
MESSRIDRADWADIFGGNLASAIFGSKAVLLSDVVSMGLLEREGLDPAPTLRAGSRRTANALPSPYSASGGLDLATLSLGGCGAINEKLVAGMSDAIPQWAGGLPADVPPRPGSAKM